VIPGIEALACGELAVPADVMAHVVHVESSQNPYAIGVVGGRLQRQPRSLAEAVATVEMLERGGHNYSVGLAQVNRSNFPRFGIEVPEQAFDACINLRTGARILAECLQRHDGRWGDAFSCYYSGNAETGYRHGYVRRVFESMAGPASHGRAIALAGLGHAAKGPARALVPAHMAARVTDAEASRRLPLRADAIATREPSGSTPERQRDRPGSVPPEEAFLAMARARVAATASAATTTTAATATSPSQAPASTDAPEVQERSNTAEDPARVF
jgi:type IV secretion system protein VirB1